MAPKRAGGSKWISDGQVKEEEEVEWPAPGGVGTTEEGEGGDLSGRKMAVPKRRHRQSRAEKRERERVAAAAALKAPEVGTTDNNQGLPGSVERDRSMKEAETGQSQQDEADEIWQDPRIVAYINRRNNADDEQRAAFKALEAELKDCRESGAWRQREIGRHQRAIQQQNALAGQVAMDLEHAKQEAEAAKAAAASDNKRFEISEGIMNRIRNDSVAIKDELTKVTGEKHRLEEQIDVAGVWNHELEDRITALESELTSKIAFAAENTVLKGEIALVHSSFEDTFSDMAKGLTIDEKFAYVREHQNQNTAPAGRPRIVSTSSLHEELDDQSDHHSDAGSEQTKAVIKEPSVAPVPAIKPFSLSGITVAETVPVLPATKPTKPTTPLGFSGITVAETVPVLPATNATKATTPLSFSGITVAETVPVVPATKPTTPLGFSGITVAETVPVRPATKPTTPLGFSSINVAETVPVLPAIKPITPVAAPKPTTPLGFSSITVAETVPVLPAIKPTTPVAAPKPTTPLGFSSITVAETVPVVVPIKKPAPVIRVQWRNRYITEHVDRPVVPWWMWLLFPVAMILCASGFAGLLRENHIWIDANDLAYQRLMGAEQETLLASVSMGVQDLLPSMGVMGHSLFG